MQTEPPKPDSPKRKRRWHQFSLRTLMILTLVIAVPCALLGRKIERKRRERAALKTIEECGGYVFYDYQSEEAGGLQAEPPGPKRLRDILGDDFFGEVIAFRSQSAADDAEMARLKDALGELPYLKVVGMCAPDLTDSGLANFAGLTQIETLSFWASTKVTDAGLQHLKRLSGLRSLQIGGRFSDAAISDLHQALPDCEINE
jgi:hypothetical protein